MKKIGLLVVLILIIAAYVIGYWPEHKELAATQQLNDAVKKQLSAAESVGRLAHLENELLALIEQTESQNYGEAQKQSAIFFDNIRKEIDLDKTAPYVPKLEAILARRDAVTAGLAKAEAPTVTMLKQSLTEMRDLLLAVSR